MKINITIDGIPFELVPTGAKGFEDLIQTLLDQPPERLAAMKQDRYITEPVTLTPQDIQRAAKEALTRNKDNRNEIVRLIAEASGGGKAADVPADKIRDLITQLDQLV